MTLQKKCRVAVFVSGYGGNMRALAAAARADDYAAEIALVASDNTDAPALDYARAAGLPAWARAVSGNNNGAGRENWEQELHAELVRRDIELIALAGFLRILSARFCEELWRDRILNIHPSLLPAFPGRYAPVRAIESGARESGATIHIATAEVDGGPILARARVPVVDGDTPGSLHERIKEREHALYPVVLDAAARQPDRVPELARDPIDWT
ncbi:MAG: phosphoribosylglycinamide formyltransferase [Alphaproteobacteria bacterium]|nr:phosphoribosylglycinamide formyltransferase [Alphaproteobacteria bacterium]MDA8003661.1 phosphoribosylglycinamide formyltransferase [Alphaproteobacteria bacterium]MDA8005422.1 phosphoribosylglycinamide formyltransferase [Alphaproteobacteria bacterium]MDA8012555.1 phosphoribosylglycinamide formyltransferase [Alphaproteobacteria bacterium]